MSKAQCIILSIHLLGIHAILTKLFKEVILTLPENGLKAMDFVFSPQEMITTDDFTHSLTLTISSVITYSVADLYSIS